MKDIGCSDYFSQTKNHPVPYGLRGQKANSGRHNLEAKMWEVPEHIDAV